ncbi:SoxR reducing system RseC family protein [Marinobacter mobilis]|uniref:Positive regulator of sigma(E), RseC/MucC n=1 Tax=Marinobacter mobilis TaxID=488533 RepID=A0A1H3A508_9GAMM|nr:SoxR reducing system RseC family protein [Marinobacter mobilis]SDX24029.1 positive regulator of sigma(E), RseC/MucC [Marinobacter mobilis]
MITETGRVIAVKGENIWVQTIRLSACNSCKARQGCGQKVLAGATGGRANQVQVVNHLGARVGDEVTLAIAESALLGASLLAYAVPLLLFVLGAVAGHYAGSGTEGAAIIGSVIGLAAGFGVARLLHGRHGSEYVPRLLSVRATAEATLAVEGMARNPTDS